MKRIFFLLFTITCLGAHAQFIKKADATNMINAAVKPLQTTITKQQKTIDGLNKQLVEFKKSGDSTRIFTEKLNTRIYEYAFYDSVNNLSMKKLIDTRSTTWKASDFITIDGTTSINMQAIIDKLKASLKP